MTRPSTAESARAPDFPTSLQAWRAWRVVESLRGYRLASVYKSTFWPPGEPLAAECLGNRSSINRLFRKQVHEAPAARCECGIYGAGLRIVEESLAALAGNYDAGRVVGEVSLWGSVVECERGYRASFAYPRRIYIPIDGARGGWAELALGLRSYGVPVELLPVRCADAVEMLIRHGLESGDLSVTSS